MNSNNLFQVAQKGFRVTVGATTSLVETLQNDQKRSAALSELKTELDRRTEEWAKRGEKTEQEARQIINTILTRQEQQKSAKSPENKPSSQTANSENNNNVRLEIEKLTEQIVELRNELEDLRQSD